MIKEEKLMKILAPYLDTPEADPFLDKIGRTRKNFHRFIYKDAPEILAHPKDFGLPEDLCEKVKDLASSGLDPVVYWDKNTSFNKKNNTLTVVVPSCRCTSVHLNDEKNFESATVNLIGGNILELDLSPKGDKAFLRGSNREIEIKIKDSKIETNRILVGKSGMKDIVVGDIYDEIAEGYDFYMPVDGLSAKERLVNFLSYPKLPSYENYIEKGRDNDITCNYLVSIIKDIAESYKLYPKIDFKEDMQSLKKRQDFAYDKDFRHIYDDTIHPAIREVSRNRGR